MASFTGIDADSAEAILGSSVVSGTVNAAGHLILTRGNGQTIDAGDFSSIISSLVADVVATQLTTAMPAAVAGKTFDRGNTTGAITLTDAAGGSFTKDNLPNALVKMTLTGAATLAVAAMPSNPRPNTQFVMRVQQDATGGRTLSFTGGFKYTAATPPVLTTTANAVDYLVFFFDGTNWVVGFMAVDVR